MKKKITLTLNGNVNFVLDERNNDAFLNDAIDKDGNFTSDTIMFRDKDSGEINEIIYAKNVCLIKIEVVK